MYIYIYYIIYVHIYISFTYIDYIYVYLYIYISNICGAEKILTTHILGKNTGKSLHFDFFCD